MALHCQTPSCFCSFSSSILQPCSPLTSAVLRAARLLLQGQPFAHVARAQQAAHDAACKQRPQAGAPAAVLTSTASCNSIPPSDAACTQVLLVPSKYCKAEACQKRAVYNCEDELAAPVADSTGPRAPRALPVPACAPHTLKPEA